MHHTLTHGRGAHGMGKGAAMSFRRSVLLSIGLLAAAALAQAQERKEVKILYDFEDPAELDDLKAGAENVTFDIVQDNGVTHGKSCCRLVFKQGTDYGTIHL